MAPRPKILPPAQQVQIERVRASAAALREGRATIQMRIQRQLQDELAALELAHALNIRRAFTMGVPKRRIGIDGMSTHDYGTVQLWLDKTENMVDVDNAIEAVTSSASSITWIEIDKSIKLSNLELADPWGEWSVPLLNGTVEVDPLGPDDKARRSGFIVTADQSDGYVQKMISERSAKLAGSLPFVLLEWIEANS
jgi:hypothetical protein